jgi:adenylate cyclase class 2
MLEIEQKFARADFAALERRLADLGARPGAVHDEADHYLNAPDRDFAVSDEALRLRRVDASNVLTYKGPKAAGPVKVRTEIEVPLADGEHAAEDMLRLLTRLGYRATAVVRKRRRHFHLRRDGFDLTVCLDDAEGLGRFAEVEIVAPPEQGDRARTVLTALAADLSLDQANLEPRSYIRMALEVLAPPTEPRP